MSKFYINFCGPKLREKQNFSAQTPLCLFLLELKKKKSRNCISQYFSTWEVPFPSWEQSTLLVSSSMDHWEVLCDGNSVSHYRSSSTGISLVHLTEMRIETIFLGHRIFFSIEDIVLFVMS